MLTRALKLNCGSLHDATKQLLIWALNKKREYCYKSSNFHSVEDDDEFNQKKFDDFIPRRSNRNWRENKWDNKNWNERRWGNRNWNERKWDDRNWNNNNFSPRQSLRSRWEFDIPPSKEEKFTFKQELKPYKKVKYEPHPDALNRSVEEIKKFYKEHNITLFGKKKDECPPPILSFDELNLPTTIIDLLREMNYSSPTPVQSMTWPIALNGFNMVGVSQTGSGKTLGFVLPALIHIQHQIPLENGEGPIALVIAPTRELGQQIMNVIQPFAKKLSLRTVAFLGGISKNEQLYKFHKGAEICVATPGRLMDFLRSDCINLSRCTYCVLDEADRLLDMGFYPQIKEILYSSRDDKQISMWSATWPKEVFHLAETFLQNYIAVKFGSLELAANPNITQIIRICDEDEKLTMLKEILDEISKSEDKKTLIFARTKRQVDQIGYWLRRQRYRAMTIHSDKSQSKRDFSLSQFRSGAVNILVGTLVVGRGLDISDIRYVVNYDFPTDLEDYVHVIGRTARGENSGIAYSFFTYEDHHRAKGLIKILQASNQEVCSELKRLARICKILTIMRRSQAPSLKTKSPCVSNDEANNLNYVPTLIQVSGSNLKPLRSTESVLDLLSNSSFSDKVDSEIVQFSTSKNLSSEYHGDGEVTFKTNYESGVKEFNQNSQSSVIIYNVVYGKQTKKKHKTWEGDGVLEIGTKYLTLKNEEGKVLDKGPRPKARKLEEGARIFLGNKEIELLNVVDDQKHQYNEVIEKKNGDLSLVKETVMKSRSCLGKRFLSPKINYSSGIALPKPNAQHQWHFNQKGLPISPVYIDGSLSNKLREHQSAGVTFLYECIMGFKDCNLNGAILADEMGLGKTLQCITLIWTLLKQGPYGSIPAVKKVLIVTPSSVTMNWYNEFIKWLGRVKLVPFCVNQKNKPSDMNGPVMIISYEMLVRYFEDVEKHNFDLLICDEGHRLKNANIRTTQILQRLNCSKRIILTGTPIQNDLHEFYSLVDFVNPNALGSASEFRKRYIEPILAARQPNADEKVLAKGSECSRDLKRITCKFLLRRTRDILANYLPPRHEIVIFCKITDVQKKLYNSLIDSFIGSKENLLGFCGNVAPLELIITLKKLCNHPSLLHKENYEEVSFFFKKNSVEVPVIEISSKVIFLVNFLQELKDTSPKEKVVVVSYSTQTLDLIEKILDSFGYISCRLDGSTPTAQRNNIVERFNLSYCNSFVFLLSAKAGGVGLNLTGASRLILFDSDWNPATDLQAIARIWRDGQKYPVFIYRLLTTGTIEEKIYQRQISKQGLCEGTIDPDNSKSIKFSNEELKDIFSSCSVEEDCLTHNILACDCSKEGEIPVPEIEPEERSCQLMKQPNACLKISELFHWEHHGRPFNKDFLAQLCLQKSENIISFIFRSCKN